MSSIAVTASASGAGVITLQAPITATNRILTLPDSTGVVLNDQSDILTQTKAALNASNGAPIYACRAWVNFNGTGTVAIRASGNVSSIIDNGISNYNVNLITALPDTNYGVHVGVGGTNGAGTSNSAGEYAASNAGTPANRSVGVVQIAIGTGGGAVDYPSVSVSIFR